MSIALIVYLAEVASSVKFVAGILGVLACVASVGIITEIRGFVWLKICVPTLGALLLVAACLIPSTEAVYKIAGVSAQQRSAIDAAGKIIEEKK